MIYLASGFAPRLFILLKFLFTGYIEVIRRRCKMDLIWQLILVGVIALAVGFRLGFIIRKLSSERKLGSAEEQARHILEDAITLSTIGICASSALGNNNDIFCCKE